MDRNADGPDRLPVNQQRLDSLGDNRNAFHLTPLGPDPGPTAVLDPLLGRQPLRDFDKEIGHQLNQERHVPGDEVLVLHHPVDGTGVGKIVALSGQCLADPVIPIDDRVHRHGLMQRVGRGTFDRLVVL